MLKILKFLTWTIGALLLVVILTLAGFRIAAAWRESAVAQNVAPASGRFVQTRSGKLFVQESGPANGVPVLLFHGTAAWSELWRDTMTALGDAGFRAIAFDIPPFGYSDRPGTYTRKDQAERARDMLVALNARDAVIVGHSFGAGAAVETAMRFPETARALVLIDSALGLTAQGEGRPPGILNIPWVRDPLVAATVTNPMMTRRLLAQMIARKERAPLYAELLQRPMVLRNTTPDFAQWLLYFLGSDRGALSSDRNRYGSLGKPVAIIWGEEDTLTPLDQAQDLRTLLPQASLTILPKVGHIPQIEDPAALHAALIGRINDLVLRK